MGMFVIDLKFVVYFIDDFFVWKGDGECSDGSIVRDEFYVGFKSVLENGLRCSCIKLGSKYYYGFHCIGMLKMMKCWF